VPRDTRRDYWCPVSHGPITQELEIARLQLAADLAASCEQILPATSELRLSQCEEPVRRFSRTAQAVHTPVERMLAVLKECIGESALRHLTQRAYPGAHQQLVQWAIDEFYVASERATAERKGVGDRTV
jgi:hypothetical protein